MKIFMRHLFTEGDNATFDLAKVLAASAVLSGIGLQIYAVGWNRQAFDMQIFGIGTGALFAGLGVALGMKKESAANNEQEPKP